MWDLIVSVPDHCLSFYFTANPSNPAYKITFPPHISEDIVNLYENKANIIKSFGLRIQPFLTSAKINPNTIEK